MKILHISPHYGAGVGTVVSGWISKDSHNTHRAYSLDLCIDRKVNALFVQEDDLRDDMKEADIVLVHYWDSPFLVDFLSKSLPECRLIFWVHKHYPIPENEVQYPDRCIGTSRIQYLPDWIWSTGDISRFLEIKPKAHEGFNIGYIGTIDFKKMHPDMFKMCNEIGRLISESRFTFVGENKTAYRSETGVTFTGKVDDVAPYLAEMDVLGYPLRPDNYGTSEQVLGEAMASGVVPVVMANPCEQTIVKHGENGFVALSEKDYVAHIEYLHAHPERKKVLSYVGRMDAEGRYSIKNMISQWNDVFDEMMTQPKRERETL